MRPKTLSVLVADANKFSRGLIADILRNLDVTTIHSADSAEAAMAILTERPTDVILASWDEGDAFDALAFTRSLRRLNDPRPPHLPRLPLLLLTPGLTRPLVISGRDAGVDEFLTKPISPAALRQRLEMVIETPRPFVDCSVYLGPCRRRKNPADYYGEKRRAGDRISAEPVMVDEDEAAKETPIRRVLSQLRETCAHLRASRPDVLATAMTQLKTAKDLSIEQKDHALHAGLASFEAYIGVATPQGQTEDNVITTALAALEQLAALPVTFADARNSVALALGKAIQKKLAA